jgi:hypothetical protein
MAETEEYRGLHDANWHAGSWGMALPTDEDIAALAELARAMPAAAPEERIAAAAERKLLRDFCAPDGSGFGRIEAKHGLNLAEVVERFEKAAAALGFPLTDAQMAPTLVIRNSRFTDASLHHCELLFGMCCETCQFPKGLTLTKVVCHGLADFTGGEFDADVSVIDVEFRAAAVFSMAHFHANAIFNVTTFAQTADFRMAAFKRLPDFGGVTFGGDVYFAAANSEEPLDLRNATFEPAAVLSIHELRFQSSPVFNGRLRLDLEQIRLGKWPDYQGRLFGETSTELGGLRSACEQYGALEENFAAQNSPQAAVARDWCHYRYMDLARRTQYPRYGIVRLVDWLFAKWCFGYGVFTKRILLAGVALILFFATCFGTNFFAAFSDDNWAIRGEVLGADHQARVVSLSDLPWSERAGNSFYFSAVTFTTIGYGDWKPIGWAKTAAAFEGMLGVFVMSLFTVSFARKIIR